MLQKRYDGFLKTPCLWNGETIPNLIQFEITSKSHKIDITINENLRLGKYVERLVTFELEQQKDISILAENIQIQQHKTTLGELDCLLLKAKTPIHLEIIYKFYVYDESVGNSEIDHFIGPNRKDSLKEKLTKLKTKQLPLLHTAACKDYLKTHNLISKDMLQKVYFKAQLFLPFLKQNIKLTQLNTNCIVGFYINHTQLKQFKNCKFYVPNKKDWLILPHTNVDWLSFNTFNIAVNTIFEPHYSKLCWIKFKNGELKKMFLVWW
ncbi:MAG: DUF1853 family protein [Winogradskyella sp.]